MRIAVYGGSFNPPHVGHAMVASWLRWTDSVDQVWLVPTAAHAFAKKLTPFEQRVRWLGAFVDTLGPWAEVCSIEASLPKPSYTFDTLQALGARHPEHSFRLVIGADNLVQRHLWHRWADIEAAYAPIVVGRAGYPEVPDAPTFPGVSSSEVRDRLAQGLSVAHLVPASVLALLETQ